MKAIICKILSVVIACGGVVLSIMEQEPFILGGFVLGGVISYELAVIMENKNK